MKEWMVVDIRYVSDLVKFMNLQKLLWSVMFMMQLISNRVYRSKLSPFEAAEFISWNSGHTLDSRICYIFLSNLAEFYIGKQCLLNSGEEGTIAYVDVNYPTRPIVRVGNRFIDLTKDKKYQIVDLL